MAAEDKEPGKELLKTDLAGHHSRNTVNAEIAWNEPVNKGKQAKATKNSVIAHCRPWW